MAKQQPEYELQKAVCTFLNLQFGHVLYLSDTIASLKLTEPQKRRNKSIQKTGFHCPDILILHPNKTYKGLFIELKVVTPFKLNGEIKASKDDHLLKQWQSIQDLNRIGYCAFFSWGIDNTIKLIKSYMVDGLVLNQPTTRNQDVTKENKK